MKNLETHESEIEKVRECVCFVDDCGRESVCVWVWLRERVCEGEPMSFSISFHIKAFQQQ